MSNDLTGVMGLPNPNQTPNTAPMSEAARQREKLKKATQDFEAVFVGMMLKQMRKSMTGGNALFGNSSDSKLYQDMSDDATAQQLSKTGGFGLAKLLYKTMEHTLPAEAKPTPPIAPGVPDRVKK
jgi:peptidoglycan hydrolase FlgJ